MAISRTPDKYKGFTFDGVDSKDFGVYIADTGAFNAPERDVEMIEIPGRNGAYALDKGRFSNIEVTYNAFVATDSESDYISGINALRNALCSRKGYCRLEDEFNPTEYRMAVYKSGLKVSSVNDKAGEFTITFDCQPQRWLKSGETEVTVEDGDTLTNPTLFEAHPLLKVKGNGTVGLNGEEVKVVVAPLGRIVVNDSTWSSSGFSQSDNFSEIDPSLYATGDTILINANFDLRFDASSISKCAFGSFSSSDTDATVSGYVASMTYTRLEVYLTASNVHFSVGTASTQTVSGVVTGVFGGGSVQTKTQTLSVAYDGDTTFTFTIIVEQPTNVTNVLGRIDTGLWYIDSTVSTISDFLYIDLDIGEAYMYDANNKIISLNDRAEIPASLPALVPGANTITVEGAINELVVIPRWWEV